MGKNIIDEGQDVGDLLQLQFAVGGELCIRAHDRAGSFGGQDDVPDRLRPVKGSSEKAGQRDDPRLFQPKFLRSRNVPLQHGRSAVDGVPASILVDHQFGNGGRQSIHDPHTGDVHTAAGQLCVQDIAGDVPACSAGDGRPVPHTGEGDGFIDGIPSDMQFDSLSPEHIFPVFVRLLPPGDAVDHSLPDAEHVQPLFVFITVHFYPLETAGNSGTVLLVKQRDGPFVSVPLFTF